MQSSLQSALDLVKFCLVVALPHPRFFGILILLSFTVTLIILFIDIFILLAIVTIPKYIKSTSLAFQFVSSGTLFFFSFAWNSLSQGVAKERDASEQKEKERKEGHFNAGQILEETDQVSKLSADIHGDSRGT